MRRCEQFYVDGRWVEPLTDVRADVEDPATGEVVGRVALASDAGVDRAVGAARAAAPGWAGTTPADRVALLERVQEEYGRRAAEFAVAVTTEMGAPAALARGVHVPSGTAPPGDRDRGAARLRLRRAAGRHPAGPGADRRDRADHPVELAAQPDHVQGRAGPGHGVHGGAQAVGGRPRSPLTSSPRPWTPRACRRACSTSCTGTGRGRAARCPRGTRTSTWSRSPGRPGRASRSPATQPRPSSASTRSWGARALWSCYDDLLADGVARGVRSAMTNSGQTCSAPTRLLVPRRLPEALEAAARVADGLTVGDPTSAVDLGPVISGRQWDKASG